MGALDLLLACEAPVESVQIAGNTFYLTSMTGGARDQAMSMYQKQKDPTTFVVCCCLCNKDGVREDPDGRKYGEFKQVSSHVLQDLSEVAMRLRGFGGDEPEGNQSDATGSS